MIPGETNRVCGGAFSLNATRQVGNSNTGSERSLDEARGTGHQTLSVRLPDATPKAQAAQSATAGGYDVARYLGRRLLKAASACTVSRRRHGLHREVALVGWAGLPPAFAPAARARPFEPPVLPATATGQHAALADAGL